MIITAKKTHTCTGHDAPVYALEQSSHASGFYSGGGDRLITGWDLNRIEEPHAIVNTDGAVYSILNIPEKEWLLAGVSTGGLHVVDLKNGKEIRHLLHHQSGIFDMIYSIVYNRLYTVSADGTLAVWSLDDLSLQKSIKLCNEKVRSLAIKKSGTEMAVACGDGSIRIFDPVTLQEKMNFPAHKLSSNCVRYHPDDNYLVSGGRDAYINFWDPRSYNLIQSIPAHNYAVYSFSFSPDSSFLASASRDKCVKIWDADSLEFLLRIDPEKMDGHKHSVNKVLWTKHQNYLLSAGDDRVILVWEIHKD